ncbi:MAG: ribosome-associated translation inhibitor RaiA [Gammaproteobacteria bacterium]|nr:ribosome-associated translation inhibitor RaiA [Gammaproteobacteria bacterium]MXW50614.1 ribosome-associated translation inhibitor RaiA [Gammaproteobacteria bacterium]MYE51021.1 ribosome-associated translation inhibitor RaiA [Gammaproteobacteria bacterium]MYF11750.1 ribosome-associated translation inhibitor RaiA [Gammaproteobacteria bacterium]MYF50302.1 ribosome-associated translation inhibitor RaiA [Gammaproteobacteria bacterium]
MQLSISGHHIDVSNALRDYVTAKLRKLERHYDQITNLHVVLSVEKLSQKAEATAHVSGAELFADAVADDLYAAIDMLLDKLDRQVIKHKEKAIERHHGRG